MSEVGVANIGPGERRKRLLMGITMLAVGVGITATLMFTGVSQGWRVGLFFPFWMGALGLFQAREKT